MTFSNQLLKDHNGIRLFCEKKGFVERSACAYNTISAIPIFLIIPELHLHRLMAFQLPSFLEKNCLSIFARPNYHKGRSLEVLFYP